ncbi:DUF4232 domain-containing protein [Pedococcus bigeumensis]|uniref:DUF4232 domain-containing protein n=1 Tax=Pedococcus bigeumensis TaxID=433644 RepID=A0A502CJB8_9MICO|nr:DUF4232 domain-containing protein [Pedococcus bigeumensis]TPG13297.1 DUF4232 domain-containing protein [Pedococcus bigeumensis]
MTKKLILTMTSAAALTVATLVLAPSSAQAATPRCTNAKLAASLVNVQGAAGSRIGDLRLTNISRGQCWTRGYPGVSYVGLGNGTQIGRAATWDAGAVTTITLAPRQHADAPIRLVNVHNYAASVCRPTPVDGLRVYVPGSTLAKFIPYRTTGCRSTSITTLFVKPLAR